MTHPRNTIILIAIALVASVVMVSCGSAGQESKQRTLSKRQYIERFNAIQTGSALVFQDVSAATRNSKTAKDSLDAIDAMITEIGGLVPPRTWVDEHAVMLKSLKQMRTSLEILARVSSKRTAIVEAQVKRYTAARKDFEEAVAQINRSR